VPWASHPAAVIRRAIAAVLLATLVLAGCGDDDPTVETAPTTPAESDDPTDTAVATVPVENACELVPEAAATSGLDLAGGVPDGDERRRVCAFTAADEGQPAATVAVQGGSRFDEKAQLSTESLGHPGEPVEGVGDRALFFFADDDIPEGVGGVLVEVGDLTLEVTLQNVDEEPMRAAATALAELAVSNL
jgi:hypothetical protein